MDFGTVFSVAGGLVGLLDGGTSGLTLGGVALSGEDSPDSMPFGGEQRSAVHKMPGGARVIDLMGADDRDMSFSGRLYGGGAMAKAARLETMRRAGKKVRLSWANQKRWVVLSKCDLDYTERGNIVPYAITCIVVPAKEPEQPLGFIEQLKQDISKSLGLSDLAPIMDQAKEYVGYAQQALPLVQSLAPGLAVQLSSYMSKATLLTDSAAGVAEGRLSALSGGVGAVLGSRGSAAAANMSSATSAAGDLAVALGARAYSGSAATTVAAAAKA